MNKAGITPKQAKKILEQRNKLKNPIDINTLFNTNFPQQRKFVEDPAKLKAIFCTRRAAKSYTAGIYMIYEALSNPGCNVLFVGLTRQSAKLIIWKDILQVINRKYKLNAIFNKAELTMTLPNGSVIRVTGVDNNEDDMKKELGKKYRLVCIDEASMYTINLSNFVYGILKPAMVDPNSNDQRGTICLTGTASNYTRGLFYDITTGKEEGWSLHTWTSFDNPYVSKQWAEELEEIRTLRPLYMETPQYRQWYLNEWVVETDKLVYKYNPDRNLYRDVPKGLSVDGWTYVLGVDTGWEDANAFVLAGYHENDPNFYVVDTYVKNHMTFDQVVVKIDEFRSNTKYPISKVIIDSANKQGIETMKARSSIPFVGTDKTGLKADIIEVLNGDLVQAKIKIHYSNQVLINELMGLVWKTDGDKIVIPKKEHPSLPNHLCDAFLYAWRNSYHYHATNAKEIVPVGSREWYMKQSGIDWEEERDKLVKAQTGNNMWGEDNSDWSKYDK